MDLVNAPNALAVTAIQSGLSTFDPITDDVGLLAADITLIAQEILKLDWTTVSGEASRSVLNALRFLRNKWSVAAGILTITEEDDFTTAWSSVVSSNAAADPIIGSDPT